VRHACNPSSIDDEESTDEFLSSTKIGKLYGLRPEKVNLIFAELGWIERYVKGWSPTDRGNSLGANAKESSKGVPYALWPTTILKNAAFLASVTEQGGKTTSVPAQARPAKGRRLPLQIPRHSPRAGRPRGPQPGGDADRQLALHAGPRPRLRTPPADRRGMLLRFLPPRGKGVYIEYWGLESDSKYRERKTAKQAIYAKHKMQLIELTDADIERLDDVLPRMLLKFGIESA
jgi:hypothetical protein